MIPHEHPFLDPGSEYTNLETAAAAVVPVPYDEGVSWSRGAALGPEAVIEASAEVETYDETLGFETCRMGIATVAPPPGLSGPVAMISSVRDAVRSLLDRGIFPAVLGGDHSVSVGVFRALLENHPRLSVIQIDAHADLRETYQGDPLSHACVMARIRESTPHTLQVGIRSLCAEEADRILRENIPVCTMEAYLTGAFNLEGALRRLPDPVYLTLDVDALDWSVIRSTGTPEPGGFSWYETLNLLQMIFRMRDVIALDMMELSQDPPDRPSAFAAAKLLYKMLGFKLASHVARSASAWPRKPAGPLFHTPPALA